MRKLIFKLSCVGCTAFLIGCTAPPKANNALNANTPPVRSIPVQAIKIEKPVNVSFSTYSEDWPVEWQWIDPDEKKAPTPHDTHAKVLRVRAPSGKDMRPGNTSAPRFMKAIVGDFQIETGVRFSPKENYQGAGLLIYADDRNFVRLERAYGGNGGGGEGIRMAAVRKGELEIVTNADQIPTEAADVQLRLVRSGGTVTAFWRVDENAEWKEVGDAAMEIPEALRAGVLVCNTAREVVAEFGYIKLLPLNQN